LNDAAFWESKAEENVNLVPTRSWMTTLIADFLEAGTKNDETAYPSELLPKGWKLIKIFLERVADEKASLADPMTDALNTEKGRVIGAMYNHALRVCRVAQQNSQPLEQAWAALAPAFDTEIAKCRDANFDFSTLSASYIANIDYMSHEWLVTNVRRLFSNRVPEQTNLQSAPFCMDAASAACQAGSRLIRREIAVAAPGYRILGSEG
jgi:hypothetical protein